MGRLGRREKFDLKDEQKVLPAAHLGDRREGGLPHNQPWGFLSHFVLSLSLWQPRCVHLLETHASSPELRSQIRRKIARNSLPHSL